MDGLHLVNVDKKFKVNSIHGSNLIVQKCTLSLFNNNGSFFILPQLAVFDGIIGFDFLRKVKAKIDLEAGTLDTIEGKEPLKLHQCLDVNHSLVGNDVSSETYKKLSGILQVHRGVFASTVEKLTYTTNVSAEIRTTSDTAVYSRFYPYPVGVAEFVNNEIEDLHRNGIIQRSSSPYNNPVWVVDKKGIDADGKKKKRLVIDFRKLNEHTVDDKYPVPDIGNILANLGTGKFFSKLDLKSGFYQINLREEDRQKTAFSTLSGKWEFCRLPLGLKNSPSIFQRAIDDILREGIGAFIFVYMDDIIIYSATQELHLQHIEWVLRVLYEANMRVSREKSEFFKAEMEYLGFIVSRNGISTCKDKVAAIVNFPEPKSLFDVRSFLGLAGYYRRFVKDFAKIAKSLTDCLKGENGLISAAKSKGVKIVLTDEQRKAFIKLKSVLASEDVILPYPNFEKTFELTTDASGEGIGAVLAQGGRPLTMISRTLTDAERNYATNERELLAIVWALKKLRNYLYGARDIAIYTDHQPLTFSMSDKNSNAKLKRWRAFVDEHNARLIYKPGKDNLVADALSRQQVHALELDQVSTTGTVHSEESLSNVIQKTDAPVNCYRNQIIIEESDEDSLRTFILFRVKRRHIIRTTGGDSDALLEKLKEVVQPTCVNAIHCDLAILGKIQDRVIRSFPGVKFRFAPKFVIDVTNASEQREIVTQEHCRAHRCAQNVNETVLRDYYFPKMGKIAAEIVKCCNICREAKYVRHPTRATVSPTPIPTRAGERVHVDIFSTEGKHFLTCVDKFSKYAIVQEIATRGVVDVTPALLHIINIYPTIAYLYCDNEASINSVYVAELFRRYGITIQNSPPDHSLSNGQVERFHSTLAELARCLKRERGIVETVELVLLATIEYNNTVHSVTGEKPKCVMFHPEMASTTRKRLVQAEAKALERVNKGRQHRIYNVGDWVFVRIGKRRGTKLTVRYRRGKVEADLGSTVLIRGRIVHKDNLRQ